LERVGIINKKNQMKKKFTFALATVFMLCSLQQLNAQWQLGGNTVAKDTSLGTKNNFAVKVITNNIERMRITNAGKIGIGTSTPATAFHVVGVETLAGNLKFTNGTQSILFANPIAGGAAMMYMLASGTVNANRMVLAHSTAYPDWGLQYNDGIDQFDFLGGGSSKMAINLYSGNVGIGTTSPGFLLDVVGRTRIRSGGGTAGTWYMNSDNTVNAGFVGMLNDDYIGLYGSGAGWGFVMNRTSGNVGIGTATPNYRLDVCGTIRAKEVRVETGWCDYVFEKNYKLRTIDELENYINENKHLPGIAPASEVEKDGLKVAEMNKAMMEKIEELTLYVIQLSKDNKKLQNEINSLKK
jgi:hypothetical protein